MLFIVGFVVFFITSGLSRITLAAIPFDQQVHDSYYVVAHFRFVIFGAAVFPILGGMYFWFPKLTGGLWHEGVGKLSFWLTFVGTFVTFFPMGIVGILEVHATTTHTRRTWAAALLNLIESLGSYILAVGLALIVVNLIVSRFWGAPTGDGRRQAEARSTDGNQSPPARTQLRRHPEDLERLPDVEQGGEPRGRPPSP